MPHLRRLLLAWIAAVLAAAQLPVSVLALPEQDARLLARDPHRILLQAASFDTRVGPPPVPAGLAGPAGADPAVVIVQFRAALGAAQLERIARAGGVVLDYVPNHALLARIPRRAVAALATDPQVQWVGDYHPAYKLSPSIETRALRDPARLADDHLWLTLEVFRDQEPAAVASQARALGADVLHVFDSPLVRRLLVRAPPARLHDLARLAGVEWIEEWGEFTLRNNTTRWVVQTNQTGVTKLWDRGLHGEGQIIGHIDGAIQRTSCYFQDPVNNTPGPAHRKLVAYRSSSGFGADGHGTHTAGTAAGEQVGGSLDNNGIAYRARISHTNLDDVTGFLNTTSNLAEYLALAHADGARLHTNSWGDDVNGTYTTWCRDVDVFSRMFEESLVMFAVSNTPLLRTPENAKNCLAVGATEQAPNQQSVGSGGAGPTNDGRRKPEIFAPGIGIRSASTAACAISSLSGTSMASPAITASGALVRQYYAEGWYPSGAVRPADALVPTGALLKATLLNGAVDMDPEGYPSFQEGWGRLTLDRSVFLAGDARKLQAWDLRHASGLATGDSAVHAIEVASAGEPLVITLVFTDQPAAPQSLFTPVNDLDLAVVGPSQTYLGNFFLDGQSAAGGSADPLNNVEMVQLGAPAPGTYTLRVRGTQVVGERQGYALVASGDLEVELTGIADRDPADGRTHLAAVEPNPFLGETRVALRLPEPGRVRLSVYSLTGQRLRTLLEGRLEAGLHQVRWDGRDTRGATAPAGVYWLKLERDGNPIEVRKAVRLN